jgi:hypothetical protein
VLFCVGRLIGQKRELAAEAAGWRPCELASRAAGLRNETIILGMADARQAREAPGDFLAGGGELGERIRSYDWAATTLGPMSSWPHSLRAAAKGLAAVPLAPFWCSDGALRVKQSLKARLTRMKKRRNRVLKLQGRATTPLPPEGPSTRDPSNSEGLTIASKP